MMTFRLQNPLQPYNATYIISIYKSEHENGQKHTWAVRRYNTRGPIAVKCSLSASGTHLHCCLATFPIYEFRYKPPIPVLGLHKNGSMVEPYNDPPF